MRIALLTFEDSDSAARGDGFFERYRTVEAALRSLGDLTVLTMAKEGDHPSAGRRIHIPASSFSMSGRARVLRLQSATFRPALARFEQDVVDAVGDVNPEIVFVASYRHPEFARGLYPRYPCVVFVEERPPAYGWGQPFQPTFLQRQLSRLDRMARRRLLGAVRELIAISPGEVDGLSRYWRRPVSVVPHAIDPQRWPRRDSEASSTTVLAVGNFAERRNAQGLSDVIEVLNERHGDEAWALRIVSANPVAELLEAHRSSRVEILVNVASAYEFYRDAAVALVPSFVVSGTKTTILQAWSVGVPVAAASPSARSVGATSGIDLVEGGDPAAVAEAVMSLLEDAQLRTQVRDGGAEHLARSFSPDAVTTSLRLVIDRVVGEGPLTLPQATRT